MLTKFQHDRFGECELVRIEGVDWIVRSCDSGQLYRVPLSRRHDFVPIDASCSTSSESPETLDLDNRRESSSVTHKDGEGVNLLLRSLRNGKRPGELSLLDAVKGLAPRPPRSRIPESKAEPSFDIDVPFSPDTHTSPSPASEDPRVPARSSSSEFESLSFVAPVVVEPSSLSVIDGIEKAEKRRLRRVFESLRNGLSPINVDSRPFAVGIEVVQRKVDNLLMDVAAEGGRSVVIRGAYGQGKTFCLQLLKQTALESGYVVASTEIDSNENRLDKPHCIYRSLLQQLVFPDDGGNGALGLAKRTADKLRRCLVPKPVRLRYGHSALPLLESEIQCRPLAWLLSDPDLLQKENLLSLLAGEPVQPNYPWPRFKWGTQGDLASFLLSGIGRLSRFLGYRGLIVILDEMEKWQNLDWKAQARAGNLLGGLIWASSAEDGHRSCRKCPQDMRWFGDCDHTSKLDHSRVQGGFPFTTEKRCSLGLAIAMTPRDGESPENTWSEYGVLEIVDLPSFTTAHLKSYVQRVFPDYCRAYDLPMPMPSELSAAAMKSWRFNGDGSTRTAIQAVMSTLDGWRQSLISQEA